MGFLEFIGDFIAEFSIVILFIVEIASLFFAVSKRKRK